MLFPILWPPNICYNLKIKQRVITIQLFQSPTKVTTKLETSSSNFSEAMLVVSFLTKLSALVMQKCSVKYQKFVRTPTTTFFQCSQLLKRDYSTFLLEHVREIAFLWQNLPFFNAETRHKLTYYRYYLLWYRLSYTTAQLKWKYSYRSTLLLLLFCCCCLIDMGSKTR